MQFVELSLSEPILRALATEGYSTATPVQAQAIPHGLAGRDVLGCAQTGTGKTAAFAIPILERLGKTPRLAGTPSRCRALVLCPTRELASQIADSFRAYGRNVALRYSVIFGGVNQGPQVESLRRGIDVIIATPGRLLDLMNQGHVDLRAVEVLVLDEADRMLDMGFIHDIRRVVAKLPAERQTMLFSATMPNEIRKLADSLLRNPASVQVTPVSSTAEGVDQSVYFVEKRNKSALLAHLVNAVPMFRTIVFTRTKHGADRVVRHLHTSGIKAEAIHGNKSQNARQRALKNFRSNKIPVLVATDIASRGIDVDGITHVVNYDVTDEPETYVHRIGRTARAGATGAAISLCDPEEVSSLKAIERLIRRQIPVKTDQPQFAKAAPKQREEYGEQQERRERTPREEHHRQHQPSHHHPHHRTDDRAAHAPRHPHPPKPRPHHAPQPQRQGSGQRGAGHRNSGGQSHRQGGGRPHPQHRRSGHPVFGKSRGRQAGRRS